MMDNYYNNSSRNDDIISEYIRFCRDSISIITHTEERR